MRLFRTRGIQFAWPSLALALAFQAAPAGAADLTFTSWGGAWQASQTQAISVPWAASTGKTVAEASYNGDIGPVKAMVAAGNFEWDIVDVEHSVTNILCEEGLIEKVPDSFWERIGGKDAVHPLAVHPCGVGNVLGSVVMAYDANRVDPAKAPKTWADFWNVEAFPGPRSLRRSPRGNLEFALVADGVPINDVYTVLRSEGGVDRAFAKLDQIKPHIVKWWGAGAEPPQLLADGEALYVTAFNGRIAAANASAGRNYNIVWDGQYFGVQHYVVPKGSPHFDLALDWMAYSLTPESQAKLADLIPYGPVRYAALDLVASTTKPNLPSAPENGFPASAISSDEDFWGLYQEPLTERFEAWLSK